ncbi:hypothetical protein VQ044_25265 [Aurantimonas sp. C2-5-R2]|uniref:hypothetical protein n=1 Tax=Aurantimonas sp. C2-5-R2 TaxID=3113713 RepID=UPI002F948513
MAGPRLVSATARRYGISRSQLATWRRTFQDEPGGSETVPTFVPAVLTPALEPLRQESAAAASRMGIILPGGRRVVVDADPKALARVIAFWIGAGDPGSEWRACLAGDGPCRYAQGLSGVVADGPGDAEARSERRASLRLSRASRRPD